MLVLPVRINGTGEGSETPRVKKTCWNIFKDLMEHSEMQKNATKNIVPSESLEFLKIWVVIELLY